MRIFAGINCKLFHSLFPWVPAHASYARLKTLENRLKHAVSVLKIVDEFPSNCRFAFLSFSYYLRVIIFFCKSVMENLSSNSEREKFPKKYFSSLCVIAKLKSLFEELKWQMTLVPRKDPSRFFY